MSKDTENQGHEGEEGHGQTYVSQEVLVLGLSQAVGQSRLEAHKHHAAGERHTGPHIVQHLGVVQLEIGPRITNT